MKNYPMAMIAGLFAIAISTPAVFADENSAEVNAQLIDAVWQDYGASLPCYSDMNLSVQTGVVSVVLGLSCRTDDNGNLSEMDPVGGTVMVYDYTLMSWNRQIMKLIPEEAYAMSVVQNAESVTLQFLVPTKGISVIIFDAVIEYKNGDRSWIGPSSHKNDNFRQAHGGIPGPGDQGGHFGTAFAFNNGEQIEISANVAKQICLSTPSNDNSLNYYDQCAAVKQPQFSPVANHTPESGPQDMVYFNQFRNMELNQAPKYQSAE